MKKLRHNRESGSALVIVILFMVLLVGLAVLFLVKSVTSLQVSSNSVSSAKASDLALSGGDIVLADLKQEIIAGSTTATYGSAPNTYTVYSPKLTSTGALSTAVPAIAGFKPTITNGIETDGLANLVKVSQYNTPFYSSTLNSNYTNMGATRASNVNSNLPALSGQVVTPSTWNSHFLISRLAGTAPLSVGSMPVTNFPSPDWIIVTRQGASTPYTAADLPNLRNSASNEYAIGRFAYAVYDEGGTLDMNVAGYPSSLTAQQRSGKSSLAFTDLTQLGLTQSQVDQIVGWRNPASAQLGTSNSQFGSVTFNAASGSNWLTNFVNYNYCQTNATLPNFGVKNGYLTVNTTVPAPSSGPNCDQMLVGRQQLISLIKSLGISPDVLQYMGTFSRSLEQPSYTPLTSRPHIINPTVPPPVASTTSPNELQYVGNNDAAGGDDLINPPFLNIRVAKSFKRFNGQTANVGEPLVISRFSLNNLAMVAYNATNATLPTGFTTSAADPDPILDHFGLTRSNPSAPWAYFHGQNSIMTLEQVAALSPPREPDFAELLKASITVGALAKGAPNLHPNSDSNYQYTIDTTTDYQVLQIMANIIDQQDTDSYPTCIQINSGPNGSTNIAGVEDLPYFYRFHLMGVVDQLPSPLLTSSQSLSITATDPSTGNAWTETVKPTLQWSYPSGVSTSSSYSYAAQAGFSINHCAQGVLANPGDMAYLYIPNLWNPHDTSTALNNPGLRPTNFRLYAQSSNPGGGGQWELGGVGELGNGYYPNNVIPENDGANPPATYYHPISPATTFSLANTELDFSDNGGNLFREPTLLWNTNPPGINLKAGGSNASITDANTGNTYFGVVVGKTPASMQFTLQTSNPNSPANGLWIAQMTSINNTTYIPAKSGGFPQISFVLQYQDAFKNWVTYDAAYPDLHGLTTPTEVINKAEFANNSWENPFACGQISDQARLNSGDARTPRWGVGTAGQTGMVSPGQSEAHTSASYLLEPTANTNVTNWGSTAANTAIGSSHFTVFETGHPRADKGADIYYSNPGMSADPGNNLPYRIFSGVGFSASNGSNVSPNLFDGLWSQNNPNETFLARDGVTAANIYMEDPDGIARRAMGAYADITTTDNSTSDLAQPITTSPTRIGLPMATASTYTDAGVGTPTQQSQSRPIVLNRPFKSVSELSYAFTGSPWKNIDFFTPESGYSALLDTFCVGQPASTTGVIAGKVDLNTRQQPVLKALIAGASRDEWYNGSSPPSYALPPVTATEAGLAAQRLVAFTTDPIANPTHGWRGPIGNVSDLVGRFIPNMTSGPQPITAGALPDWYTYAPPTPAKGQVSTATYAGFTALLDSSVYNDPTAVNNTKMVAPIIQRFREAALRPLADCGQTRVWNLLIDVIAEAGKYPPSATGLDNFAVEGEKRLWIHVAIDRYTGQILDEQIENVAQ